MVERNLDPLPLLEKREQNLGTAVSYLEGRVGQFSNTLAVQSLGLENLTGEPYLHGLYQYGLGRKKLGRIEWALQVLKGRQQQTQQGIQSLLQARELVKKIKGLEGAVSPGQEAKAKTVLAKLTEEKFGLLASPRRWITQPVALGHSEAKTPSIDLKREEVPYFSAIQWRIIEQMLPYSSPENTVGFSQLARLVFPDKAFGRAKSDLHAHFVLLQQSGRLPRAGLEMVDIRSEEEKRKKRKEKVLYLKRTQPQPAPTEGGEKKTASEKPKRPRSDIAEATLDKRLADPYYSFLKDSDAFYHHSMRLDQAALRAKLAVIQNPQASTIDKAQAYDEVYQSVLGLIPWAIGRFAGVRKFHPGWSGVRPEELVGIAFEVIYHATHSYSLEDSQATFTSYLVSSLGYRISNALNRDIDDWEIPFYLPVTIRMALPHLKRAYDELYILLEREPTAEELCQKLGPNFGRQFQISLTPETIGTLKWRLVDRPYLHLDDPREMNFYGGLDPEDLIPVENNLAEFLEDPEADVFLQLQNQLLKEEITAVLDELEDLGGLSGQQRSMLVLCYGLAGEEELNCGQIGKIFGCTRVNARKQVESALRKLRHSSIAKKIIDFLE